LRLQHSRPVEIAAGLMADHGMPLDDALDRAMMRLHAEEGTAEAGEIGDVIGKEAFDETQRVAADGRTAEFVGRAASPDLAQPAPGLGQSRAATEEQARPNGEHASGDRAAQGGDAAGGRIIGNEDAAPDEERAYFRDEPASAAVEGEGQAERLTFGDGDEIVRRPSGEQHLLPTIERIGDEEYTRRAAHGELDPKPEEEPPDKGPLSDDRKQSDLPTAPRPKGGVSDSAAGATAIDFFNQLAAPELTQSQALTDHIQQRPRAAAAEGVLGLGIVLGIPAAGLVGLLGAVSGARTAVPARWKVGDGINALTKSGREPTWSATRSRFWKNEATNPKFGPWKTEHLERMRQGLAPQRYNSDKGALESMDLSHEPIPFRDGGTKVVPRWPQEHARVDPFRRPGY
jgi:hypothetical protein